MPWETNLIDEQKQAASHTGSHARLLAGPGTGKTLVLTRRIMYLIEEKGVNPERILALTFTRAAAFELRQRVSNELGEERTPRISTLHSFALRQLLRNSQRITSLPQPLRIADDWEERHIILEDIKRILDLEKIGAAKEFFQQLSADWESLTDEENFTPDPKFIGAWREHRKIFGYTLRSELVYQLKRSLEQINDFDLEHPILHLLIDEYQDLNKCDLAVIKAISDRGVELFVAGDDDQSIYFFRKAHPDGIRNFLEEYEDSINIPLEICKRCDPSILRIAEFVADLDFRRLPKGTRAEEGKPDGEVRLLRFDNEYREAEGIARLCAHFIHSKIKPEQILLLVRTDTRGAFSKELRKAFDGLGVPISSGEEASILDNDLGRQVLATLRLARNIEDHLAWRTLLKLRKNGFGDEANNELYEFARNKGLTYFDAIVKIVNEDIPLRFRGKLVQEYQQVNLMVEQVKGLIEQNNEMSGVKPFLNPLLEIILPSVEDREVVFEGLSDWVRTNNINSIDDLLNFSEASDIRIEQEIEEGKVNILTMHKAKGLTADIVFVVAAEDEHIPGRYTDEPELGDERRLLFVSLTRARHMLFITYCNERVGQQRMLGRNAGDSNRSLTQFLRDSWLRPEDGTASINRVVQNK